MTHHPVYLEMATDGRCVAHVLDRPGCVIRAPSRDEALRRLPDAIRNHHAWLRRHGEPAPPDEDPITVAVAGESAGGPFDPGDAAALLPLDREPVTTQDMEGYFRLMAHARADLLALVRDLPDDVLDWQPDPQSFSIRRLLRHVGHAEEWYVSRLVPPDTLPPEWEHDEDIPLFEFLAMERRHRRRPAAGADRGGTGWHLHADPLDQPPRRAVDGAQSPAPLPGTRMGTHRAGP